MESRVVWASVACGNEKSWGAKRCRWCYSLHLGTWGKEAQQKYWKKHGRNPVMETKTRVESKRKCLECGRRMQSKAERCLICRRGSYVPRSAVLPIIKELVTERHYTYHKGELSGGSVFLAEQADVDPSSIRKILDGTQASIAYTTVDKILTKTGNAMLWYEEPLRAFFHEPAAIPERKPLKFCACGKGIRQGEKCRECYNKDLPERPVCACGAAISRRGSKQCWACFSTRSTLPSCACGKKLTKRTHKRCLKCSTIVRKRQSKWASGKAWQVA